MGSLVLPLVLLAALQVPIPPPPPPPPPAPGTAIPRDAARDAAPRTGTAVIRGKVTDQETGEPIPRAMVAISSSMLSRPDPTNPQSFARPSQATTGSDGRFEFKDLPAGDYTVSVMPGEFRATHLSQMYGVTGPMDMTRPRRPKPLTLRDGEVRDDVNVALWRAFAIEGRVVDEFGEPMTGVEVYAKNPESGQPAPRSGPWQMITDDRGLFRLFGIAPGRYLICATPRNFVMPSTADVKERAIQTCHPAAVVDSDSVAVTVTNGDIGGIDIRIRRSGAFTVSGSASAQVKPDLTFELSGLFGPLTVQVGNPPRGWIAKSIRFKGEEIIDTLHDFTNARASDLLEILLTSRGARVSGRVLNDRGEPTSDATVMLLPADAAKRRSPLSFGPGGASPKPDGSYQLGPVRAGEYLIIAVGLGTVPNAEYLEQLVRNAERITLVEDEQQSLDLRIAKLH